LIADTFWENRKYLRSNDLRKMKIRSAKARMFSEAQKIEKMKNIPKPTSEQINIYDQWLEFQVYKIYQVKYFILILILI